MAVIEAEATRMRAPLHAAGQQWHVQRRARAAGLPGRSRPDGSGRAKRLFGRHQFSTIAGLAIATCARRPRSRSSGGAFEAGIVNRREWPARMQRLTSGALVDQGPKASEIWLDGGHNPEGGRVAAAALGGSRRAGVRPLVVIVSGEDGQKTARASSRHHSR